MVSFSCETCNDTLKKPKLDSHAQRCRYAVFTCLDCNITFQGTSYRGHTSCISEDQKYQKSVYKAPKGKGHQQTQNGNRSGPATVSSGPQTPTLIHTPSEGGSRTASPSLTNGIHPDRLKMLERTNPALARASKQMTAAPAAVKAHDSAPVNLPPSKNEKKRPRNEIESMVASSSALPLAVTSSTTPTSVVVKEGKSDENKKSKKQRLSEEDRESKKNSKKEKKAAKASKKDDPSKEGKNETAVPKLKESLNTYLKEALPRLLEASMSIRELLDKVVSEAKAKGLEDSQSTVEKAVLGGVLIGGDKPKKRLRFKFDA